MNKSQWTVIVFCLLVNLAKAEIAIDNSFGTNSLALANFDYDQVAPASISIQQNRKILVAGFGRNVLRNRNYAGLVARFNENGTLDTSFNQTGKIEIDVSTTFKRITSVLSLRDGRTLAFVSGGGNYSNRIILIEDSGSISTFAVPNLLVSSSSTKLLQQIDGKVLVGNRALMRYNLDGSIDTSFGAQGLTEVDLLFPNTTAEINILQQSDGKIVLTGAQLSEDDANYQDFALARINLDGQIDEHFGNNGLVVINLEGDDTIYDISQQSDGKLLISGEAQSSTIFAYYPVIVRVNVDGTLDSTFGNDGVVSVIENCFSCTTHSAVEWNESKILTLSAVRAPFFSVLNESGGLDLAFPDAELPANMSSGVELIKNDTVAYALLQGDDGADGLFGVVKFHDDQDSDADGTPDYLDDDDDNDGMSDEYELANGLDPFDAADAALDLDEDGLTNLQEFELNTAANNVDTDGDGISDSDEINAGSDPLASSCLGYICGSQHRGWRLGTLEK